MPRAPLLDALVLALRERRAAVELEALRGVREDCPTMVGAIGELEARRVLEQTTDLLLDTLAGGESATATRLRALATSIGVRAADAGVPVDEVSGTLRAYQRAAWASTASVAVEIDLDAHAMAKLMLESVGFADRFTHAMLDAWVVANAHRTEAIGTARQSLLTVLLLGDADARALQGRAEACGWSLPQAARVAVAIEESVAWPRDALAGRWGPHEVAILGPREPVGGRFAVGPRVPLERLPDSLGPAVRLAALPGGPWPARWEQRLLDLVMTGDEQAVDALEARWLARVDTAPARQRAWLIDTLRAWLDEQGSTTRLAHALTLHPQSARYRISRLRELYGDALDDPRARLELTLALQRRAMRTDAP